MIMDINERSKEYAEGKALSALNAAIEQAYKDGYNDGLKHLELERLEVIKEGVEYVDLGLPSGTLWSSICISDGLKSRLFPYTEASKLSIPTKEQFEELIHNCKHQSIYGVNSVDGYFFIGKSGKRITVPFVEIEEISRGIKNFYFWLRDDNASDCRDSAVNSYRNAESPFTTEKIFMGYKLPVMLVKNIKD